MRFTAWDDDDDDEDKGSQQLSASKKILHDQQAYFRLVNDLVPMPRPHLQPQNTLKPIIASAYSTGPNSLDILISEQRELFSKLSLSRKQKIQQTLSQMNQKSIEVSQKVERALNTIELIKKKEEEERLELEKTAKDENERKEKELEEIKNNERLQAEKAALETARKNAEAKADIKKTEVRILSEEKARADANEQAINSTFLSESKVCPYLLF